MEFITAEQLQHILQNRLEEYRNARPFAHLVIDNFFDTPALRQVVAEFEQYQPDQWVYYHHFNEKKQGLKAWERMGPITQQVIRDLQSPEFMHFLIQLTGIDDLLPDPDLDGGGLHEMKPGGFLNIHVDFLAHTVQKTWSRQVNLLLFLNENWQEDYQGHLELWDADIQNCEKKVLPVFNRCVIFHTSPKSYHGVPEIIRCPEGQSRKSIALYYFRDEKQVCKLSSTHYKPRPADPLLKKMLVWADRSALRFYSLWKRYFGVSEESFTRLLKRFNPK